ncbi:MAG: hypothetical protein Q7T41_04295, partial [Candidatus Saccharibacteria bacterium]|nr:hypothetical protein [Candidatus Saccharibacteria bacterium]
MSTTNQDDNTDDINNLQPKKDKIIQPLNPGDTLNIHGANEDLLAELRQRTAELADQIQGHEDPLKKVLKLENSVVSDEDVIAALKEEVPHDSPRKNDEKSSSNPAVELVRQKLAKLYKKEPDAADEAIEAYEAGNQRSKHQKFMYELTTSGKSLADIQTQWHNYYTGLPDDEKHQVWTEFYETQSQNSRLFSTQGAVTHQKPAVHHLPHPQHKKFEPHQQSDTRTVGEIKTQLYDKINAKGRLSIWQHVKSLLFGLSMAALVGLLITFTF